MKGLSRQKRVALRDGHGLVFHREGGPLLLLIHPELPTFVRWRNCAKVALKSCAGEKREKERESSPKRGREGKANATAGVVLCSQGRLCSLILIRKSLSLTYNVRLLRISSKESIFLLKNDPFQSYIFLCKMIPFLRTTAGNLFSISYLYYHGRNV